MIKKILSNFINGKIIPKNFSFFRNKFNKSYLLYYPGLKKRIQKKLYIINNARIIQSGNESLAILYKNYLIKELSFQSKNLVRKNFLYNKVYNNGYLSFFTKKLDGTAISLLQDISQKKNYFHFLFDSICKIYWIEKLKIKYDYLLIPSLKKNFQRQIVRDLNINKKIIDCDNLKTVDVKKLVVIDHPYWEMNNLWQNDIKHIPAWSIKYLKKKFSNSIQTKNFNRKIYIDRSASNSPHNQIQNIIELKQLLIKFKFKIVDLSKISFQMQKNLFKNAKIIIGPHDAGFANLVFCPKKTNIIEFRNKNHAININAIGAVNKLNHNVWMSKINGNGKMIINLEKLEKFLKKLDINF